MSFSEKEIDTLHNTTIFELAMRLEDDLAHSCRLDGSITVYEYIKNYLHD
ncbi:hypothetical protein [Heyndrickxia camelliae]|nr:hypothetical protein [Heyndrickxia camelliae]